MMCVYGSKAKISVSLLQAAMTSVLELGGTTFLSSRYNAY